MKLLTVLGSTGSIGTNTLDVVRRGALGASHQYQVYALVAGRNVETLVSQIREFRPQVAVVATSADLDRLIRSLEASGLPRNQWPELSHGEEARIQVSVAPEVDTVISAIVGVSGLTATYEAIRRGKRIGLANKEVLVSCGKLVMDAVRECGAELVPVDSEHNGAHQCLRAGNRQAVARLILTASGGPFRNTPREALARVTPDQALNHPTWRMGNRITIDSATLMNKGFEVIEACWLFGFAPREVDVVIHPQSTVHAMIEYTDGSVLAQIAATDMRMPIQYALTYPDRVRSQQVQLDWSQLRRLDFEKASTRRFRCLGLAREAMQKGGALPCALNAADEVAVAAFLDHKLPFLGIPEVVEEVLSKTPSTTFTSIAEVLAGDAEARQQAADAVARLTGQSVHA
jgi:1-deoxy-D-xylulose-5-phosphate reductoisomerase